jgi:GNAT superfamily N-acetyltransferase
LDIRIVPLDATHDRAAFSCGKASVDAFLHDSALARGSRFLGATRVAAPNDPQRATEVLGYYTLATHEYRDEELPSNTARKLSVKGLKRVPMILLAQLGVQKDLARQGLGKTLMRDALEMCLMLAQNSSAVAVITDAIDADAMTYYMTKFDFKDIGITSVTGLPRLFLAMKTIEAAYVAGQQANAS